MRWALLIFLSACFLCAGGENYDPAKATGMIKGVVSFLGDRPEMPAVQIREQIIHEHRDTLKMPVLRNEELVISGEGRLANFVVYVSKGQERFSFETFKAAPVEITSRGAQYFPHVAAVMLGQPFHLVNNDPYPHNWHCDSYLKDDNQGFNVMHRTPG